MRSLSTVLGILALSLLFKEHYLLPKFFIFKRIAPIAKRYTYIKNRILGKAAGASPVGVEAEELLRAATLWSSCPPEEDGKKSQLAQRGAGIGYRRMAGGFDW